MNEKQFEDIEKRIREAASNANLPFEQQDWKRMEALLDNKDKRRPLFWIISILLLFFAVATGIYFSNHHQIKPGAISKNQPQHPENPLQHSSIKQKEEQLIPATLENNQHSESVQRKDSFINVQDWPAADNQITYRNKRKSASISGNALKYSPTDPEASADLIPEKSASKHKAAGKTSVMIAENNSTDDAVLVSKTDLKSNSEFLQSADQLKSPTPETALDRVKDSMLSMPLVANNDTISKKHQATETNTPTASTKKAGSKKGFYLFANIGPEVSQVKLFSFNDNPVSPRFGIGLGYQFNRHWALQTGFFASHKKYIAGPDDYKPKPGSYWNNVQIISVDADCLVYEIPINLRYYFALKNRSRFFGSVSISSYLMKKESYDYTYIYFGYPVNGKYDYTGNNHLFSVVGLSAGYEHDLNKRFSFYAEPLLNIPLKGVGDGQIKLYSLILQIGAKFSF
jgi:hypothetical protein